MNDKGRCDKIAYSVSPEHQPIIVGGMYFCKYCLREVEVDLALGIKPGWFHKMNGKHLEILSKEKSDKEKEAETK